MDRHSRRHFLSTSAWMVGSAFAYNLYAPIAKAQAIPAFSRSGSLMDVEHVVILMQENRSFDHYFGALSGVRGFADPQVAPLAGDRTVWHQSDEQGGILTPFRFDVEGTNFQVMKSLPHDYGSGHVAWNGGRYDQWLKAKGRLTMGYLRREDIPFHHALADAFTLCDAYFSSIHGPTCPNRLFMLTGSNDPRGLGGGPVTDNNNVTQLPDGVDIYGSQWVTYAERLQSAGITWQAYRQGTDPHSDDDSDGGMNLLLAFASFINAKPGDPLYERGVAPRRLGQLKSDVLADKLPQVSWIFPPRLFCEHPKWPPAYGANYIARILDALTSNPLVWSKTMFLAMYDENDGFFDHVVPPVAPGSRMEGLSTVDTAGEFNPQDGTPYGLGPRVPMLMISPWSRGGFVCSEVFDHTSILRFLEARFGVPADDITPWRRAVCGDLQSAFDFTNPNQEFPATVSQIDARKELATNKEFQEFRAIFLAKPKAAAVVGTSLPRPEPGRRRVRPLGYDLAAEELLSETECQLRFTNHGRLGAALYVYDELSPQAAPRRYTLSSGGTLTDAWPTREGRYSLLVHGPNGFTRRLAGHARASLYARFNLKQRAQLQLSILAGEDRRIEVRNIYTDEKTTCVVRPGKQFVVPFDLSAHDGWYGIEIRGEDFFRHFTGKYETGSAGWSDPALA